MTEKKSKYFAKNLRFIRKAAGISVGGKPYSQAEFAEKLDVTKRSIILWESGSIPNRTNLDKLSKLILKLLGVRIPPEILLEKDITGNLELLPRTDFEKKLSVKHRKILRSLFLSAGSLDENQLLQVIEYIDNIKED